MGRVLLVEPWLDGSHRQWAEGYRAASSHDVAIVGLPGRLWRWRLRGGALLIARLVGEWVAANGQPDVLVVTGLVDVSQLVGFTRRWLDPAVPVVVYQHESQLIYPSPSGTVDQDAVLRNWLSWCAADAVYFNSQYHLDAVDERLPGFLKGLPDRSHVPLLDDVVARFDVLPVGVDLGPVQAVGGLRTGSDDGPVVLWPHRWEPDKDPAAFAAALDKLAAAGLAFQLVLAGEDPPGGSGRAADARREVLDRFGDRVLANGPLSRDRYTELLGQADLVVSCARQENFGVAVVEAVAAGCLPLLPAALAYPEVIPARWHDHVLYEPGNFGTALVEAVARFGERRQATEGLAESMSRFDWSTVGPYYDQAFADVRPLPPVAGDTRRRVSDV